ncbi:MAG: hypothetical protein UT18_C0004G0005 [candidate division CPR2 bacterium GW2011_GWC2_39_10]|uniref:Uncharacterized protein n=1 Tax=candidate division CPR2 bacterium GW2011_GWC2_39_10 TaxID=1618345 RepID=A0A0G0LSY3_UNCC2|nr:MAG: hypothetical protein UT18_C0004G0005 [candidate division CPR2 bacterium GW2011_GWC2_39_10]
MLNKKDIGRITEIISEYADINHSMINLSSALREIFDNHEFIALDAIESIENEFGVKLLLGVDYSNVFDKYPDIQSVISKIEM